MVKYKNYNIEIDPSSLVRQPPFDDGGVQVKNSVTLIQEILIKSWPARWARRCSTTFPRARR
jgi:hypothetical protein